jgi:hypothetical protein
MAKFVSVSAIDINACELWLDASDLTTLFQSQSGGDPITASGQSVGCWMDKSGKRLQLSAANAFRPLYRTNAASNGLPSIEFNGSTSMFLGCSSNSGFFNIACGVGNPGFTVFIACQRTGTANQAMLVTFSTVTGSNVDRFNSPTTSTEYIPTLVSYPTATVNSYFLRRSVSNTVATVDAYGNDITFNRINQLQTHIVTYGSDSAQTLRMFLGGNNVLGSSGNTSTVLTTNTPVRNIRVGASTDNDLNPGYKYPGHIHELIVFDRYLNTEERKLIEAYLGEKWRAPYQTYCVKNGDFNDPSIYFNETVPTLTSAWVIPNGFNVTISADQFLPNLTTRKDVYTTQYTDTGSFIVTNSCSLTCEKIIQQARRGDAGGDAEVTTWLNGAAMAPGVSPTLLLTPGVTLNLNTDMIASQHRGAPVLATSPGVAQSTLNLTRNNTKIYGYSNSAAISGINFNLRALNAPQVRSGKYQNTPANAAGTAITITDGSINVRNGDFSSGVNPLREPDNAGNGTSKLIATNCTGVFENCNFGTERDTTGLTFTNCNVTLSAILLSGCTVQNTYSGERNGYYTINFNNTNAYVGSTVINGGLFNNFDLGYYNQHGINTENGGNHTFVDCTFRGGFVSGQFNASTANYDRVDQWANALRYNSGNGLITNSRIIGNAQGGQGTGVCLNGGTLQINDCTIEATNTANGIARTGGTLRISSNMFDGPTGVKAVFTDRMFVDPIPKNSFIRYASDGTGVGFNAYIFQYTIDSLSAFSMPPPSAVRLGVPYAAFTQVGQAVIPPTSAVSYGTLVDNTTGSAVLTLELLNTLFTTPLTAMTTPGTIGYRVANSVASNQSVGHLIASFTTS